MSVLDWTVLATAAVLVGLAKTAFGAVGAVATALFATVLPARQSTGALLPLLLSGDVIAVTSYRRHADWSLLLRLFPSVAAGILVGVVFVARVDDTAMSRTIGGLLLLLVALTVAQRRFGQLELPVRSRAVTVFFGLMAGFTTMVANAGGPVMSLYLLAAGTTMLSFLGTGAWFFLVVNLFKLPFSIALGLIDLGSLALDAKLLPALLVGALIGRLLIRRLNQAVFETLILGLTTLSAVNLLR